MTTNSEDVFDYLFLGTFLCDHFTPEICTLKTAQRQIYLMPSHDV